MTIKKAYEILKTHAVDSEGYNDTYTSECPFCGVSKMHYKSEYYPFSLMSELPHRTYCVYLTAKEIIKIK